MDGTPARSRHDRSRLMEGRNAPPPIAGMSLLSGYLLLSWARRGRAAVSRRALPVALHVVVVSRPRGPIGLRARTRARSASCARRTWRATGCWGSPAKRACRPWRRGAAHARRRGRTDWRGHRRCERPRCGWRRGCRLGRRRRLRSRLFAGRCLACRLSRRLGGLARGGLARRGLSCRGSLRRFLLRAGPLRRGLARARLPRPRALLPTRCAFLPTLFRSHGLCSDSPLMPHSTARADADLHESSFTLSRLAVPRDESIVFFIIR
jgi:hypothetical protein